MGARQRQQLRLAFRLLAGNWLSYWQPWQRSPERGMETDLYPLTARHEGYWEESVGED